MHFKLNLFTSLGGDLLRTNQSRIRLIDLRTSYAAVKDIPRGTNPNRPLVVRLVPEHIFRINFLGDTRIDTWIPARLSRFLSGLGLLNGVISHSGISAVLQSISGAVAQLQIVLPVSELFLRTNNRISGQTNVVVQIRNRNVVSVLGVYESLHSVCKFDLRLQNVDLSHGAHAELRHDVS